MKTTRIAWLAAAACILALPALVWAAPNPFAKGRTKAIKTQIAQHLSTTRYIPPNVRMAPVSASQIRIRTRVVAVRKAGQHVDPVMAGPLSFAREARARHPARQRHAHGIREALSERPRRHLDTGRVSVLRVARRGRRVSMRRLQRSSWGGRRVSCRCWHVLAI